MLEEERSLQAPRSQQGDLAEALAQDRDAALELLGVGCPDRD